MTLIFLPLKTRVRAEDGRVIVTPIGPIYPQDGATTIEDVRTWFERYLGRAPHDDNEAIGYGRIGKPRVDVELEIATSPEAIAYLESHGIQQEPPLIGNIDPSSLTAWSKRAGLAIAAHFAQLTGASGPTYGWIVFAEQAQLEDAGGNVGLSQGAANNNPLNLSVLPAPQLWPDQTGIYLGRFASFLTLDAGAKACAINYQAADYAAVAAAWRAADVVALAHAVDVSPWNEGGYGGRIDAAVARDLAPTA